MCEPGKLRAALAVCTPRKEVRAPEQKQPVQGLQPRPSVCYQEASGGINRPFQAFSYPTDRRQQSLKKLSFILLFNTLDP